VLVNIVEVDAAHIEYKKDTNSSSHQFIPVSDVSEIHCSDYSTVSFNDSNWRTSEALIANGLDTLCPEYLYKLGKYDADLYYDSYHPAGSLTFFTTTLFGGLPGLIPAMLCSRPPKKKNLNYPSEALINNTAYYNAYQGEATHIKRNKILGNYLWGYFFAIASFLVLTNMK
jgi:hypothetical protein